jgi:hypothetical protein
MKIRKLFLLFLLIYCYSSSFAQEKRLKYFGIEGGATFIESEISNMDNIRGSMPSYYMGYSSNSITSLSYKSFIGVKAEIFSLNDRFGLLGGIRLSRLNASIGKNDYFTGNTNYFYWLYREDGVNTEYLKVKEVYQKSDYIGIPIEIRFFTEKRPRIFQLYIKMGLELSYLLSSKIDITFTNSAMDPYEKDMIADLKQPEKFNMALYGGAGFKIGRDQKPSLSIEACVPFVNLTSESYGIIKPLVGGGFQLNFQIPIKTKSK